MKSKLSVHCIAYIIILCVTVLAYALFAAIRDILRLPFVIWSCLLPAVIVEAEICFDLAYFLKDGKKRKLEMLLKGMNLLISVAVFALGVVGLFQLLLDPYTGGPVPFAFGTAVCLLGGSKLLNALYDIICYRCCTFEKSAGKVFLLTGKTVFALLVICLGYIGMLLGAVANGAFM